MQTFKLIPFDLDDGRTDRRLKYTGPGVIQIERSQEGRSILVITNVLLRGVSIDVLSSFVWGGLLWQDPDLKLVDVQDALFRRMCTGVTLVDQLSPVIEALMECGLLKPRTDREKKEGNGAEDPQKRATEGEESPPPSETGTSGSNLNS
jgi:hypothetical protein